MATWKENGEVPDSDEDDISDSQSVASTVEPEVEVEPPPARLLEIEVDEDLENQVLGEESFSKAPDDRSVEENNDKPKTYIGANPASSCSHVQDVVSLVGLENPVSDIPNGIENVYHREHFSVTPQPSFNVPVEPEEHVIERKSKVQTQDNNATVTFETRDEFPSVEEISRSYIRLSPKPDRHPPSLTELPSAALFNDALLESASTREAQVVNEVRPSNSRLERIFIENQLENRRRNLRERKAIQMHPYLVEQQKYRQTLKSRGITPMRIENTSFEGAPKRAEQASQNSDTQDDLFQSSATQEDVEFNKLDSSEARRRDSESVTSSILDDLLDNIEQGRADDVEVSNDDDADGLPSIAELIQRNDLGNRSRMRTYSTKRSKSGLSNSRIQPPIAQTSRNRRYDPFDLPNSPPVTSSPRPHSTMKKNWRSNSPTSTFSSKEPTPSLASPSKLEFQHPAEMPTPAMSVSKLASKHNILQIDSDSDNDPFAVLPVEESDQSSSSDEATEIRKVGRRLGGVLPASHLRLVQQQHATPKPHNIRIASNVSSPTFVPIKRPQPAPGFLASMFSDDESDIQLDTAISHGNRSSVRQDVGSAEEDDRIDAMLPSRSRQTKLPSSNARKRKRTSSTSIFGKGRDSTRQTSLARLIGKTHKVTRTQGRQTAKRLKHSRQQLATTEQDEARRNVPRLGILDVTNLNDSTVETRPDFIRIAARTARKRKDQGRQSPSRKFIRLANREDTLATQNTLNQWKAGAIGPRQLDRHRQAQERSITSHLSETAHQHTPNSLPIKSLWARPSVQRREQRPLLVTSRAKQVPIDAFLTSDDRHAQNTVESYSTAQIHHPVHRRSHLPRQEMPLARPAQLESTVLDYQYQHPVAAFKKSKKALDALYRSRKKNPVRQANVQLTRFLADDDDVASMVDSLPQADHLLHSTAKSSDGLRRSRPHPKKNKPTRLDADAAIYRQPSEPLILDYFFSRPAETLHHDGKLVGLAAMGTKYPTHFDILPMQSGVYFHESTFIGSGRLSIAIKFIEAASLQAARSNFSFRLADTDFSWGAWDEKVSSEMGICFDWLIEYLRTTASIDTVSRSVDVTYVITCIVDYTQHHLSFTNCLGEENFVVRMVEILQDVYARIQSPSNDSQYCVEPMIQFLVRVLVFALQILKISRKQDTRFNLTCQVEEQLKNFGRLAAHYMVIFGLDNLRRIYDDLQYLSVRERGIRDNHHIIQAWVVFWKVFNTAKIVKSSFWEIVYAQLPQVDLDSVSDASIMEKIWYSIFTLLPLAEFNDAGVVNPLARFGTPGGNWILPQRLLKRVFNLYTLNPRQPPGFNDYSKALLGRCHYLICEWGWWGCSGLIGTIFDFFAAQKLAHLRNEEAYKSPHFLEELHLQPSLDTDPDDRCFHVFLKIVALVIQHMCQVEDLKGIRNLVARLLPNHDRQYPKEQAIHHRELASLRNHHDLLCTLYWAAPADLRPSVVLLQNLVVSDESHKEACMINLQAWLNIARFVLVSTPDPMLPEAYEPLAVWQSKQFSKILTQYDETETDIRKQVEQLPPQSKKVFTESELQATIKTNRQTTLSTVEAFMNSFQKLFDSLPHSPSLAQVTAPANLETFASLFNTRTSPFTGGWDTAVISIGVEFVEKYLFYLAKVDPETRRSEITCTSDEDSQDFGSIDVDAYDFELLGVTPIRSVIVPAVRNAIRQALYSAGQAALEPGTPQHTAMTQLTRVWGLLVSLLIQKESAQPADFLIGGQNTLFDNRHLVPPSVERHVLIAADQWPLFLGTIVKNTRSLFPDITQRSTTSNRIRIFNLGMEWMMSLALPEGEQHHKHVLTVALHELDFFLLQGLPEPPVDIATIDRDSDFDFLCLRTAIDNMNKLLVDSQRRILTHNKRSLQEVKEEFAYILRKMMQAMESKLKQTANLSSPTHQKYVKFVQKVAQRIRSHAKDILPLPDFFVHSSVYFWPDQSDPTYQLASLRAYTIRLSKGETGATWETFHYIYNAFKIALLQGDLISYTRNLRKAARAWPFFCFMIDNMIPAAIEVAFKEKYPLHAVSWTLCAAILPVIRQSPISNNPFDYYIEGSRYIDDEANADHAYQSGLHIIRLIMKGLSSYTASRDRQPLVPNTKGVISLVCQLGDCLIPSMVNYLADFPEKNDSVIDSFSSYMSNARDWIEDHSLAYSTTGDFTTPNSIDLEPFIKVISSDMMQWIVEGYQYDAGEEVHHVDFGELVVKIPNHGTLKEIDLTTPLQDLPAFYDVLQNANHLTVGEYRFTSKLVPVLDQAMDINENDIDMFNERKQRFRYRETSRTRVLMALANF
ncbi:Mus7/MMS22 family protein [Phlyctema vagabunda]|uniref:Mus7/MMS22 family protein n=1 Tax=Phlyctema vagabunda TaxID=108571 RepID=A0ABR4PF04_9HELO